MTKENERVTPEAESPAPGGALTDAAAAGASGGWGKFNWIRRVKWWSYPFIIFMAYFEYSAWDTFHAQFIDTVSMYQLCDGRACLAVAGQLLKCISFHGILLFWIALATTERHRFTRNIVLLLGSLLYPYLWQMALITKHYRVFQLINIFPYCLAIMWRSPTMIFGACVFSFVMMLLRLTLLKPYDPETDTWRSQYREFFFGKPAPAVAHETKPIPPSPLA